MEVLGGLRAALRREIGLTSRAGTLGRFALPRRMTLYVHTGPAGEVSKYTGKFTRKKAGPCLALVSTGTISNELKALAISIPYFLHF